MDVIVFLIFAAFAVGCGINVVVRTHPVSSALSLIGVMASLAVLYLLLGAPFIAAAQVLVYAGAIMVLFIFVIMLLNTGAEQPSRGSWMARLWGVPLLIMLLASIAFVIFSTYPRRVGTEFGSVNAGTVEQVGKAIFTTYLLPFEITSILVLIAILGAVVLGYKELD